MKTNFNKNILALKIMAFAFILNGCIEEFGSTGEPFNRAEQITGTWTVTNVMQRDLTAENPLYATLDITDIYEFKQYAIILNADGSFAISNAGNAPDFVITSGTWALDNAEIPSAIVLTGQGSSSMLHFGSLNTLTETNQLHVNYVRTVIIPKEEIKDAVEDKELQSIAYEYTLSKSN